MTKTAGRVPALDLLRGAAVAGMILVTSPGDWAATYSQLRHADWNGWTAADMVFPAFLFSVGIALGLSFPRAFEEADARRQYWWRVGRRVVALIVLGLALETTYTLAIGLGAWFPGKAGLENLRIPGILQRIALCYGLSAVLLATTARRGSEGLFHVNVRAVAATIVVILIGYWALLSFVPVPGYGAGRLDVEGNLPGYIDRMVFGVSHLWPLGNVGWGQPVFYDPEGLLSTLPAATNTLLGVLAAVLWRRSPDRAPAVLAISGIALIAVGLLLDPIFVINKRIWTSSFAVLSSGIAAIAFAALAAAARSAPIARLLTPLRVLGGNAILAFILSTLFGRLYGAPLIGSDDDRMAPAKWLDQAVQRVVADPYLSSLICAVAVLALITLLIWPLHRRAIHFRV
jgi:predicted acyltransferase